VTCEWLFQSVEVSAVKKLMLPVPDRPDIGGGSGRPIEDAKRPVDVFACLVPMIRMIIGNKVVYNR
jgi:hypothetical protein